MSSNLVLFSGQVGNALTLWETDGTSAGTWQILVNGRAVVDPGPMVALGSKVLFAENPLLGNNNHVGLWVSDGTSFGTSEISVAGASTFGVQPTELTRFGSEVLFQGTDSNNIWGLWVTDGTSAGTTEILVNGANARGVAPLDLTAFGTEVLFSGWSANGNRGLWVTDGTSAGTSEIPVAGASSNGLSPAEFAVIGTKALFGGADSSNGGGLWVTDGTAAGTSEFWTGFADDLTAFGSEALFSGMGFTGLWATDGTTAGTTEITSAPFQPYDLTVFGSEVLFAASTSSDRFSVNLWVTDGTAAGTSEISVSGAGSQGLFFDGGRLSPDFIVDGDKVLFAGRDANGNRGLWVTDGTSAGTSEISVAGAHPNGINPSALTAFTQDLVRPELSNVPADDFVYLIRLLPRST
jgi:ELWxxDGT repeat protein